MFEVIISLGECMVCFQEVLNGGCWMIVVGVLDSILQQGFPVLVVLGRIKLLFDRCCTESLQCSQSQEVV